MIYRLMYVDGYGSLHSRRYADKDEANKAFSVLFKDKNRSIRSDVLNEHGQVVKTQTFGPNVSNWDELLCEYVWLKKVYFAFAYDDNTETTDPMTDEEAEKFIRGYAGEPGFGTEWVWVPQAWHY